MLAVLLSAWFMAQFDYFVVNVAAPSFQRDLHAGPAALQLIIGGYAFCYAAGMITGGRLGDMLGHRRMFVGGVLAFAVTSLLCGLAASPAELIVARLAQGLAGAMMVPQVLAVITTSFPPAERARAIGWYGVAGGIASVAGQVLGGWLLSADILGLGWRVIFFINVPVGAIAAVIAARVLPSSDNSKKASLDIPGAAGIALTLGLVLVPLTLGRTEHWPAWTWACLAASVPAALVTASWQRTLRRRGGQPVLETPLFRYPSFSAGLAAIVAFMGYFATFVFVLTLLLQDHFGLSAFRAGLSFAPLGICFAVTAIAGRWLSARYGAGIVLVGSALTVAGLLVFTMSPGLPAVIVAGSVISTGNGLVMPELIGAGLTEVRPDQAGIGAGMLTTAQQFAGSAGVTVIGSVFFAVLGEGYPAATRVAMLINVALVVMVAALVAFIAIHATRVARPAEAHPR
jgi:EmrB/QacA subfamily drug resistance transporter